MAFGNTAIGPLFLFLIFYGPELFFFFSILFCARPIMAFENAAIGPLFLFLFVLFLD